MPKQLIHHITTIVYFFSFLYFGFILDYTCSSPIQSHPLSDSESTVQRNPSFIQLHNNLASKSNKLNDDAILNVGDHIEVVHHSFVEQNVNMKQTSIIAKDEEPKSVNYNNFVELQDQPDHGVTFGARKNKNLLEALKKEEFAVERAEGKEEKDVQDELKIRDAEKIRIKDYAGTVREGGLEGSVGAVTYDTPNKLQDKVLEMVKTIDKAIDNFKPEEGLESSLKRVPPQYPNRDNLLKWGKDVPYINFVSELLKTSCAKQELKHAGDPKQSDAFPRCMIDYVAALPEESKKDMGLRLRSALQSVSLIEEYLNLKDGLCVPVAKVINLEDSFCTDVLNLFKSVAAFIKTSTVVQEKEKEYYGTEAAMLQLLREDKNDEKLLSHDDHLSQLNTNNYLSFLEDEDDDLLSFLELTPTQRQINALQGRLVFRRTWIILGMHTMKQEAIHLEEVWYNDPVHKWRYSLGIFQWITILGVWLAEEVAKLSTVP